MISRFWRGLVIFIFLSLCVCFSPMAFSDVLYPDPDGVSLDEAYRSITKDDLISGVNESDPKYQYLMGLLYWGGDEEFGVEDSPSKAYELLRKAWDAGIFDAGYTLAFMFDQGKGVKESHSNAKLFLEQSAQAGFVLSQRDLGKAYLGELMPRAISYNVEKAVYWLEKAAISGDQVSAAVLSSLYYKGDKVSKSEESAFHWRLSATRAKYGDNELGNFLWLGRFYERGVGVKRDIVQAYKCYDLSGTAGSKGKERVAEEMTQDQIDEATRQSRAWQEEHNIYVPSYSGLEHQSDGSYQ